ncbi:MAG: sulfatase [Planctomycetota bacterium]
MDRVALLFLIAGLTVSLACGRPDAHVGSGQGLLVIAIDGLRADHLGAYGHERETAPTLAALARDGLLFEEAFSSSPRRLPAHAALLTGCDPLPVQRLLPEGVEHALVEDLAWSWSLPEPYPSLAVELLANGWETAAFVDHENLAPTRGFRRGFAHWTSTEGQDVDGRPPATLEDAGLAALADPLGRWLRGLPRSSDWFAYMQLDDLERAWQLPSPTWERYFRAKAIDADVPPVGNTDEVFYAIPRSRWRGQSLSIAEHRAFYDGHVRRLDGELKRLLDGLELTGRNERTTIVVIGSYGVQFGEAGRILASGCYSMADLHVPWIIRPSAKLRERLLPAGTRIDGLASGIDLAPTLLGLADVPIPFAMHGVSQVPVLNGREKSVRSECFASLGLLGGWASIGPRLVVETLELDHGADAALVRSWGGSLQPGEPAVRAYDRTVERFPEPGYVHALPPGPEVQRLAAAAEAWYGRLNDVREVLRRSWFDRQVADRELRALEDEGWIQRAP